MYDKHSATANTLGKRRLKLAVAEAQHIRATEFDTITFGDFLARGLEPEHAKIFNLWVPISKWFKLVMFYNFVWFSHCSTKSRIESHPTPLSDDVTKIGGSSSHDSSRRRL